MKPLSSIFSFSTLRGPWPLPVAGVLAAGLLLAAEGVTRVLVKRGTLPVDPSLHELVSDALRTLRRDRPTVWLLGNSTLAAGVDEAVVGPAAGGSVAKLPHGSATVRGLAAMLDFYLRQVEVKPRQVFVFATKDDFNPNGYRAEISRAYLDIQKQNRVPADGNWLMLRAARGAIQMEFVSFRQRLVNVWNALRGRATQRPGSSGAAVFSGAPIAAKDAWFGKLAQRYTVDAEAFAALAEVRQRYALERVVLVLLPVTDVLARFQDEVHPTQTYASIRGRVAELSRANGIELVDWSEPTADYRLFRDPYHLNDAGKQWLSAKLADWLARPAARTAASPP